MNTEQPTDPKKASTSMLLVVGFVLGVLTVLVILLASGLLSWA